MCDFDITLIIFLSHLKKIHTQFFTDFDTKDDCLKDTKFYIGKLKNEIFSLDKVISFEHLIPHAQLNQNSFEGQCCDRMHLPRSDDLRQEIAKAHEQDDQCTLKGLLLVPDNLSARKVDKLNEKYTSNQIKLTGALWFYLSLHFFYELPSDLFNPVKQ